MTFIKSIPEKAAHSTLLPQSQSLKKYNRLAVGQYTLPECGTRKSYHLGCRCDLCKQAEREYRAYLKGRGISGNI